MNTLLERKQKATKFSSLYTPEYATEMIVPYLHGTIWECACGEGHMTKVFRKHGLEVIESDIAFGQDFLTMEVPKCDYIVTNPPYKHKDAFLERCYTLGIPFALLLPLTALGAQKRVSLYNEYGLEMLVPDKRIHFIYPTAKDTTWFHSAWFCHGVLPEKLMFVEIDR
jgi:hypothetical protein